ncbi:MAG TPA: class II fructose-bisphosphatase [Planctomycetota bacterium]|nr:class II fructose-bisphosphatase [Planctomycetota bacterium]
MPTDLAHHLLPVVEAAAVACSRSMGRGDRKHCDRLAVEAMRLAMDAVPMRGRIVIGEGERDEAPMLWIDEEVGLRAPGHPRVDIAVDPLEGTNLCATGGPSSICVLAASPEGGLLHAPDCYMNKIVVGPRCRGRVHLDAPVADNLRAIADALQRGVEDLVVVVLDRPRHETLVGDIRAAGARIRLISDGDLAPAIGACVTGTGVHAVMGTGGAPEGVLSAVAVRCLGGFMQGRLVEHGKGDRERAERMGVKAFDRLWTAEDLAPGERLVFAATGVTDGDLLRGVDFFGNGARTHSVVMTYEERPSIRFVDTIHIDDRVNLEVRL